MKDEKIFLDYINDNYNLLKNKYRRFCKEKEYDFDEDIFSDTILKCYEAIQRKGKLDDTSNQGIENYFFRSFKQNLQREKQYCRVSKRDLNIKPDDINHLYETWFNEHQESSLNKIKNDLFKDFSILYLMKIVEDNFSKEDFHLFQLKMLVPDMTYKKLSEKTKVKGVRQRIVNIKNWLKLNISKKEIIDSFQKIYGEII